MSGTLTWDGTGILFMESDSGYTVAGTAEPLFTTPQSAVVNAASFDPAALSSGGIFSIFGQGLPTTAGAARVLVNGESAPVFFANGTQVNAQIPYDVPTDAPVPLTVSSGSALSNTVQVNLKLAAPGIFTSPGNRGIVQNADYTINSPSNPTHAGLTVIVDLTGGGIVTPPVTAGTPAPSIPLSTLPPPYSFTVGGVQAGVSYLGLTPGLAGLSQANVVVPGLAPGDYRVVATIASASSNGPMISIR